MCLGAAVGFGVCALDSQPGAYSNEIDGIRFMFCPTQALGAASQGVARRTPAPCSSEGVDLLFSTISYLEDFGME